jgi:hypothetical protein
MSAGVERSTVFVGSSVDGQVWDPALLGILSQRG